MDLLPTAESVINSQLNSATGHTPFELLYGYTPDFTIPAVTIPPLDPSARDEEEPDYDEEALVWAAAMEHAAGVENEETPDEYDWQISRLVSTATYTARPDAGRVLTGRMKITRLIT